MFQSHSTYHVIPTLNSVTGMVLMVFLLSSFQPGVFCSVLLEIPKLYFHLCFYGYNSTCTVHATETYEHRNTHNVSKLGTGNDKQSVSDEKGMYYGTIVL